MTLKTYRRHNCTRSHRTAQALNRCIFPRAVWIQGEGRCAVVAWCGQPSVTLFPNVPDAEKVLARVNAGRCGGKCRGWHELILLPEPADAAGTDAR